MAPLPRKAMLHRMSEFFLELVINVIGGLLEIMADYWFGDLTWSDCKSSRIFWGIILLLLVGVIWWELR
jgi:hypothetical protein